MRRALLVGGAWLLGCGPLVSLELDDGTESAGSDGTAGSTSVASVPVPVDDSGGDDGSVDPDGGSSGGTVDPGECWLVQELLEAPADVNVQAVDQDGDGADELWLSYNVDNGPGPGSTTLIRADADGVPQDELPLDGFLIGIEDVEGDGLEDLLLVDFSGGFPPVLAWAPATGPGTFLLPPLPLEVELSQGLSGFFDADGDGLLDVFELLDTGELSLRIGDGTGSFLNAGSVLVSATGGRSFVSPVEGLPDRALFGSYEGFGGPGGPPPGCTPATYELLDTTGGFLSVLGASAPPGGPSPIGTMFRTVGYPSGTVVVYAAACDGMGGPLPQLRQLSWTPDAPAGVEATVLEDIQWAAPVDIDADGLVDVVHGQAPRAGGEVLFSPGTGEGQLGAPVPTGLSPAEVRSNRVQPADLDGDGREEVLRGAVIADGDPPQLLYERLYLGPCGG